MQNSKKWNFCIPFPLKIQRADLVQARKTMVRTNNGRWQIKASEQPIFRLPLPTILTIIWHVSEIHTLDKSTNANKVEWAQPTILERENRMKRRKFLKTYMARMAVGAASLPLLQTAYAGEQKTERVIDVDKFCERAYEQFIPGKRTCCESILMTGCEVLAIQSELVPDIALGLAGGVGLQGEICGVLTACALVLSLAVAQKEMEYPEKKMRTLQAAGRVHNGFKKQFGKTDCRSLCGLDLTTPEGRKKLEEIVKEQTCTKFVQAACELLARELQNLLA